MRATIDWDDSVCFFYISSIRKQQKGFTIFSILLLALLLRLALGCCNVVLLGWEEWQHRNTRNRKRDFQLWIILFYRFHFTGHVLWYSDRNQCFFSRNVVAESSCSRPAAQSQSVQQIGISLLLFCAGFHSNIPSYKLYLLKSCCTSSTTLSEKRVRDFFVWVMMMRIYSHAQKQHKIKQGIFLPWLFFFFMIITHRGST